MKDWKESIKAAIEENKRLSAEFAAAVKECLIELEKYASGLTINVRRLEGLPYGCEVTIEKKVATMMLSEAVELLRKENSEIGTMKQAIEQLLAEKFNSWIF